MRIAPLLGYLSASIACSLLACSVENIVDEDLELLDSALNSPDNTVSADIAIQSWQNGYCANVTVKNVTGNQTGAGWRVVVGLNGSTVYNQWSANFASSNGQLTASNLNWNGNLKAGTSTSFGFCANGTGKPSIVSVAGSGFSGTTSSSSSSSSSTTSSSSSSSSSSSGAGGSGGTGGSGGSGGTGGSGGSGGSGGGITNNCTEPDRSVCSNQTGTHCGYTFEYWKDSGSGCQVNTSDGFTVEWSNINNLLGRKGIRPGSKNQIVTYEADYRPNGNSYLGVYGWTKNPLIEYYIIDSWGSWRPPGGEGFMGTVTSDGGTYDIYRTQRVNQPSIEGNKTFYQFWSVRKEKRTRGTITVANHFNAWQNLGMNLGSLYEVSMVVEGYQSSGSADVSVSMK